MTSMSTADRYTCKQSLTSSGGAVAAALARRHLLRAMYAGNAITSSVLTYPGSSSSSSLTSNQVDEFGLLNEPAIGNARDVSDVDFLERRAPASRGGALRSIIRNWWSLIAVM